MFGKKLINNPDQCVDDSIAGLVASRGNLALIEGRRVVTLSNLEDVKGRVAIVCGGGSGHEPAFAGYVGAGMLDAAVAGSVFTSPPVDNILAALTVLGKHKPSGILVLVINYTGDRINFGLAAEKAKSVPEIDCNISLSVMGEDCALQSLDRTAGRRGLAGIVLAIKIVGSMAQKGHSLADITSVLNNQVLPPNAGTIGLSLSPCVLPGRTEPSFNLGKDEMVMGLGIHGESGVRKMKLASAKDSIAAMLEHMTNPKSATSMELEKGARVVVLVNNLCSVTNLEMGIVANDVINQLSTNYGVIIERIYIGGFVTSLEMGGISISILKLQEGKVKVSKP